MTAFVSLGIAACDGAFSGARRLGCDMPRSIPSRLAAPFDDAVPDGPQYSNGLNVERFLCEMRHPVIPSDRITF